MKKHNLILITGLLRSGTTWTGKTIARAKGLKYIIEPFNPDRQRKNCPVRNFYQIIDRTDPPEIQDKTERYIKTMINSPPFYLFDQIRLGKRYGNKVNLKNPIIEKNIFW